MTNFTLGRWLLVAVAVVGLAFAAPVVSAHSTDTTADDTPTDNATADQWAIWMEAQMTEHMGPGSIEWMESQMGVTVEGMAQGQGMADEGNHNGTDDRHHNGADDRHHDGTGDGHHGGTDDRHHDGTGDGHHGGMYGQGHR